jgi:hypothetical protein
MSTVALSQFCQVRRSQFVASLFDKSKQPCTFHFLCFFSFLFLSLNNVNSSTLQLIHFYSTKCRINSSYLRLLRYAAHLTEDCSARQFPVDPLCVLGGLQGLPISTIIAPHSLPNLADIIRDGNSPLRTGTSL